MRFSPVLLAALTASATLGLTSPIKAETPDSVDQNSEALSISESSNGSSPDVVLQAEQPHLQSGVAEFSVDDPSLAVAKPEAASVEFLAQENLEQFDQDLEQLNDEQVDEETLPDLEGQPGNPPAGTATPQQNDNPDELQFEIPNTNPEREAEEELQQQEGEVREEIQQETEGETTQPTTPSPTQPTTPSPNQPSTPNPNQPDTGAAAEPRVLVAEVAVSGAEGDLLEEVYRVVQTQPGRTTTRSQLQEDINAIFATGFFSNVRAVPEDTPLGVRVTFVVQANPPLQDVELQGSVLNTIEYQGEEVPLGQAVDDIFGDQYGQTANLRDLQRGIDQLNQLYQDNGYVLAQVIGSPQISSDGVATLEVAEGVIEDVEIRFLNRDGEAVDEEGNPVDGRTRPFIITREFDSKPGDVFNQNQIQADLRRAFGLGIFEDLNISLDPGQDPRQVDVIVNVIERRTGSLAASAGVSSSSGLFGAVSFQEQNLGGNNQRLNAEVQVGQRDVLFDLSFTDPWIATDPNRLSYTVSAFGRQSISLIFDGGEREVDLPSGNNPRVRRVGGGVSFTRPFDGGWLASAGLQYQNVSIRDSDGDLSPRDEFGNLLSFNDSGIDNIATVQLAASRDRRNDPTQTTQGSFLRLSTEQALGIDSLFYNRLRASYSYFIPLRITRFTEGCRQENPSPSECPQTLAFNVQGGTILGDFPPYEAFALGGTDSVRGYDAGDLGSGKSYLQATVEYRFPIFSIINGALFFDVGTDLGTAGDVPGDPAGIRDKPGSGFGYGAGVRVQTPLGQIRVDYAINDQGDGQVSFGIGERF